MKSLLDDSAKLILALDDAHILVLNLVPVFNVLIP